MTVGCKPTNGTVTCLTSRPKYEGRAASLPGVAAAAALSRVSKPNFARTARALRDEARHACPNFEPRAHARPTGMMGDARLEFFRNSARRLKMREHIERAG